MKETLLELLEEIQDDAEFLIYKFNENGTFNSDYRGKKFVLELIEEASGISVKEDYKEVFAMEGTNLGVYINDFTKNIDYKTENTDSFMNYISKYNRYYNVFIKLDEVEKTITFKLGDKEKTLQLIEKTKYVSKPHYKKYMKCVSVQDLKRHIEDEFWNPRMVDIGRKVLGIKDLIDMD